MSSGGQLVNCGYSSDIFLFLTKNVFNLNLVFYSVKKRKRKKDSNYFAPQYICVFELWNAGQGHLPCHASCLSNRGAGSRFVGFIW